MWMMNLRLFPRLVVDSMITETAICSGPLTHEWLHPGRLCQQEHGAIASFLGVVRNEHNGKGVTHLEYECYESMALPMLTQLIEECRQEHDPTLGALLAHGYGYMKPGEVSVAIHVSSAHRVVAFAACRQLIERIKEDLPVWKDEYYTDGSHAWLKGS